MATLVSNATAATHEILSETHKLFTCIACHVAFSTAEYQRNHYRSDWHRYNLKRKVASLPPVSSETFAQRILAKQTENKDAEEKAKLIYECTVCSKVYASENAYQNHISSKKHQEQLQKQAKRESWNVSSTLQTKQKQERHSQQRRINSTDMKENKRMNLEDSQKMEKDEVEVTYNVAHCLFCNNTSEGLAENVKHMAKEHSFFIPDIEYLVDLSGLIEYLGKKILHLHGCLWCFSPYKGSKDGTPNPNTSTKGIFKNTEDVRKHMRDKGHCKIFYDDGADIEVADFYDFSETWNVVEANDADDGEWEDLEDENFDIDVELSEDMKGAMQISPEGSELILPSGIRVGNRAYARYYKQSLRTAPENGRDSVVINRLVGQYKLLGYSGRINLGNEDRIIDRVRENKRLYSDMKMGVQANKLQRHFRQQVPY